MNWNEMTPRERQIEKLKDYALATAIALILVGTIVAELTK